MNGEKILIIEPDAKAAELAVIKLSNAGYLIMTASNGEEALQKIASTPPDIVLINPKLPQNNGYEVCLEIRKNPFSAKIPIILLVDPIFDEEQFKSLRIKVDDILLKPFSPKTLLSRVNALVLKVRLTKKINPLTELPGKIHLQEALQERISEQQNFKLIFCDLKDFKIFNKNYGFDHGNEVIKFLANLIQTEVGKLNSDDAQLYHLGGDDFCILLAREDSEEICKNIISQFDTGIPQFYSEDDRNRGGIVFPNRRGVICQWPVLTLAMGIVHNDKREINNWLEAELIGTELLEYLKTIPGSQYGYDRRSS